MHLAAQWDNKKLGSKVLEMVAAHTMHCKDHIRQTFPLLQESYETGLETGDVEYGTYSVGFKCMYSLYAGLPLTEVELETRTCSHVLAQFKQENILNYFRRLQQLIFNLIDPVENPGYLSGSYYNEDQFLPIHLEANDRTHLYHLYLYKLILSHLFEDFSQALQCATQAELYLDGVLGTFVVPMLYFYDSLVRLALYPSALPLEREQLLLKAVSNQEKMERWAHHAPANFQHKYNLIEAEKAQILGRTAEAMNLYEQSIAGAKENQFLQEEALAYELASKFYLAHRIERIAQTYMKEAHYCYQRWGAKAKVAHLEANYPRWFAQSQPELIPTAIASPRITTNNYSHVTLDLATVMKASQAIFSQIELDQLLRSLMEILIESAGAQAGFLILETSGAWAIEASGKLNSGEDVSDPEVLQSIPIGNHLPESIINYVIHTHEDVALNDATREGNFINDPYIQRNQTKSILCLPLLNQNKLIGVLYLENQLAVRAFTSERSSTGDATRTQVLHLLSIQAAIAIENAKLYSEIRASESRMAQFLEAIPVGIGIIDAMGRPYYFNQRAVQLSGKESDSSVSLDRLVEVYQVYLAGTDRPYPTAALPPIRALSGERSTVDDIEIHQNDKIIPVEVWSTPVFDEQGNVVYAIAAFQDITDRKQAEKLLADYNRTLEEQVAERTTAAQQSEAALRDVYDELRLREQQLRLITDALPVCISYTDANQCYQFVNQTYEEWFGCSRDEIVGRHVREIIGEAAYQAAKPYINRVLAGQITVYETELPYPSGTRYVSGSLIPDFDANHQVRGYYGLITDITQQRNAALRERKQAEETTILNERNRMAREIHDTLAQAFTGVLVHMGTVSRIMTTKPEAVQTHINIVRELARNGLIEARRSVAALRPQSLEDGNLWTALEQFVSTMQSSTQNRLTCEVIGTSYTLLPDTENNLLRIGQEAVTNAIKYAQANEIRIELVYEPTSCYLRIKDDGQGFEADNTTLSRGFGLLGMTERAEHIGAQLSIKSQLGQGTEVIVSVQREAGP